MYDWDILNPEGYGNQMGKYKTKMELSFILSQITSSSQTILDLGGGSGRFAFPLIEKGHDVTVIDLNQEAVRLCKERGLEKAFCKDIRESLENKYNLVLAIELFLVTPPKEVFEIAYKNLEKEGKFIFVGTNKNSWRYKLHKLKKKKTHNFGELSVKEYKELLSDNNFYGIIVKGFNWMPFKVNSNNFLVPLFALLERFLRLNNWISQSPWLLFSCKKK